VSARSKFTAKVRELQRDEKGLSHSTAVQRVARRYPDLHKASLDEANEDKPNALADIRRRFED
jgi:hypothetical protein